MDPDPSSPLKKVPRERFNSDVKCMECGAYNITDNKICGACGANLPVIYDREGRLFHWESDSPYWDSLYPDKAKKKQGAWKAAPFILRAALALVGVLFVLWLMAHRSQ